MRRITVGLRLKPENIKEYSDLLALKGKTIEITLSGQKYEYNFDDIFDEKSTNDYVFNVSCKQIVGNNIIINIMYILLSINYSYNKAFTPDTIESICIKYNN
jgi:hypothetical protein